MNRTITWGKTISSVAAMLFYSVLPWCGRRCGLEPPRLSCTWSLILVLFGGTSFAFSTLPGPLVPPPKPVIAPLIAETYPNDVDGDRVDDQLAIKTRHALAAQNAAASLDQKALTQAALDAPVDVELVFKQPVTQSQIDHFVALGGEITYLYKAVSYGWNGRFPLGKLSELTAAMGSKLVLIQEAKPVSATLYEATRTGRVRPIWAAGFAESQSGFTGDTSIAIGILDSGVDFSHPDFAGRRVYYRNFTDEAVWSPGPMVEHGTMVAGVATGSGAASGSDMGTLYFTQVGDLSGYTSGEWFPAALELPAGEITLTMTGMWKGGGSTRLALASYAKGTNYHRSQEVSFVSGTSPLTLTCTVTGGVSHMFSPKRNPMATFPIM